jgi:hypothetical protein
MELCGADILPSSDVRHQGKYYHVPVSDKRQSPKDTVLIAYRL